jgi:hypothetical protein
MTWLAFRSFVAPVLKVMQNDTKGWCLDKPLAYRQGLFCLSQMEGSQAKRGLPPFQNLSQIFLLFSDCLTNFSLASSL